MPVDATPYLILRLRDEWTEATFFPAEPGPMVAASPDERAALRRKFSRDLLPIMIRALDRPEVHAELDAVGLRLRCFTGPSDG